jgi:hypothetical protein
MDIGHENERENNVSGYCHVYLLSPATKIFGEAFKIVCYDPRNG